jgi:hypothetical protein
MEEPRTKRWRRGWWWKVPAILGLPLVLLAPALASPLVRGAVASALEEQLGGEASFEDLSLSWPANLTAKGLRVLDPAGRPVLSLSSLEGSLDARALLRGRLVVDARLHRAELHLRQQADGSWQLGEPPPADSDQEQDEDDEEGESEDPGISGDVWLEDSRVVLHAPDGEVALENLELGGSLPADLSELATFHLAFDAEGEEGPAGSLRGDGKLALGSLAAIDPRDIEATLEVDGLTLAALRPVLALWLPERIPSGTIDSSLRLTGESERLQLTGRSTVTNLEVEVLSEDGDEPLVIRDPEVVLNVDAELVPDTLDLNLRKLTLDSRFARCDVAGRVLGLKEWVAGTGDVLFDGLAGEVVFVPDRLTELLGPDLPIQLPGADERRVSFSLEGSAAELDLESFLAGCVAQARIELGSFATTGIQGSGDLELEVREGRASWTGSLLANEGTLDVEGEIELAEGRQPDASSTARLAVETKNLRTNAELAPLLSLLHPAFAAVEALQRSEIAGSITSSLDLEYEGPLTADVLAGDWQSFPKQGFRGSGSFAITQAHLDGTPALAEVLAYLGIDTSKSVNVRPIEFTIAAGRLTYARPWTWTIDDVETTFSGSVGLDQTLALSWNIPVKGTVIQLPIRGTVTKPELEWRAALSQLARGNVQDELDDLIGQQDDAEALFEQANRLWDANKKNEAAAIYQRIREEFKISVTYALNRKRIKKRAKYQE